MIGSNARNNAPTASATEGRTDEQHAQSVRPIRCVNHNRCEAPGLCSPLMRSKRPVASLICVRRIRRTSHQNSQLRRPQGPINMKFSWQATDSRFYGNTAKSAASLLLRSNRCSLSLNLPNLWQLLSAKSVAQTVICGPDLCSLRLNLCYLWQV